ncbi:hypothetical protein EMGBS10_15000 [Opitutia bacterium]|nr:hypothetical protein EMGBS10_15000 [Opitutae bacterium]
MKLLTNIVGALLGLFFVFAGLNFFFEWQPIPPPPAGTPAANFIDAMKGSGYLKFIKILEIVGGLLLVVPCVRNWGLVVTGAITVNIACVHQFFFGGIKDPAVIGMIVATVFLAWAGRKGFCCLACCGSGRCGSCCCSKEGSGCCSSDQSAPTGGCCGGK